MSVTRESVFQALRAVRLPGVKKDVVAAELVPDCAIDGGHVTLILELPSPGYPEAEALADELRTAAATVDGVTAVDVKTTFRVRAAQSRLGAVPGVKNVIAVASGKGGVGKSTVAVNLAAALHRLGAATGLLDLDIYGPSVPVVLGNAEEARSTEQQRLIASTAQGLRFLSMGQFAQGEAPVVWRGPMLHKMVTQMIQADWGELDYLVLDLPPGTGDVQLTVTQNVPVTGAVIVTTPQEIALIDARKGLTMFRDARMPILGLVENMAYYKCGSCDREHALFGRDGGARLAEAENIPMLARLPLDPELAASADAGRPLVAEGESETAHAFLKLAAETAAAIGRKSLSPNPFPVLS
ncbi:MAG: Mrp/NBP35 family ATP-binding protein [Gemmatimonadetes bacterium]|nr:Mrp/NBP35 family ATP-binding protein [Gemmatimonadota bacterium]